MKHPTWTPPINGWQYRIARDRYGGLVVDGEGQFELHSKYGHAWVARINDYSAICYLDSISSLEVCCAVLDAALKARKS